MKLLKQMGISMMALPDGRVQLLHSTADAESAEAAAEGIEFMQDVLAGVASSSASSSRPENVPQTVSWASTKDESQISVQSATAGPAQFGKVLTKDEMVRVEELVVVFFVFTLQRESLCRLAGRW